MLLFEELERRVKEQQDNWLSGAFDHPSTMETLGRNATARGYARACYDIMKIEYTDLNTDEE